MDERNGKKGDVGRIEKERKSKLYKVSVIYAICALLFSIYVFLHDILT